MAALSERTLAAARAGRLRFGLPARYGAPFKMLRRDKFASVAAVVLLGVILSALAAPLITPYDPGQQDLMRRLVPPFWSPRGDLGHPLGTDQLGRDLLSRLIASSRISLFVALVVVVASGLLGTTLGLIGGFFRGKVDEVIMGITDIVMAFPGLLLVMVIAAMMGPSLSTILVALSLRFWTTFARMSRGLVMSVREAEYVTAAVALGCSTRRCLIVHILPNILSPMLTVATLECARIMLAEAGVSFLGFGVQRPLSSWGLMLAEGRDYLASAWWLATFPGLALFVTILTVNTLASFMRLATDPMHRGRMRAADASKE